MSDLPGDLPMFLGGPLALTYSVPQAVRRHPKAIDLRDLSGEDISLRTGDFTITSSGDWTTVDDVNAARQSVEREACATPGEMPRRPEWGMGLKRELMRPLNEDSRNRQISSIRRRLQANRRISKINEINVQNRTDLATNGNVTVAVIKAESAGKPLAVSTVIKPGGGR